MRDLADERSSIQLCDLAKRYAKAGDDAFRTRLYEIVEQKPFSTMPWLGQEEILELDGGNGFVFAARIRGVELATREWEWDDRSFIDNAVKRLGENKVNELLESDSDEGVRRFRNAWDLENKKRSEQPPTGSHEQRMRAITVNEIISIAESEGTGFGLFRGWGMYADPGDLRKVLQRLWAAENPTVIVNYLSVFSNRALPEFDARLMRLCRHGDDKVQMRAFSALAKNTSPLLRKFALSELENGLSDGSIASLFINNYESGDEERILDALEMPSDENERHWLLMDINKVLATNPKADASKLGVVVYACTPCENCRFAAFQRLKSQIAVPPWMTDELRYDSNEGSRTLVTAAADPDKLDSRK